MTNNSMTNHPKSERDDPVTLTDRVYDKCIRIAERSGSPEIAAKLREEKSWEGLGCGCGGGWKVGHRSGCPESPINQEEDD